MKTAIPRLATIGEIASALDVRVHQVEYILRTRPHIRPRATAGTARCFDDAAIAAIRHEVNAIAARRKGDSDGE